MSNIRLNLLGKNNSFNIFINEKKIEDLYGRNYNYESNDKEIKIKLVQKHICDSKHWFLKGMLEFVLGLLSGVCGYSDFEENIGPYRAYCESVIKGYGDKIINIELKKKRIKIIPLKYTFKFYINVNGENSELNEIENIFESPKYLKIRWNIIRIPYILLAITILIVLILAVIL